MARMHSLRILIRELSETLLLSLLIFIALQFSVQNFTVEGDSMSPTLEEGRYVLVNKLSYLSLPGELRAFIPLMDGSDESDILPFGAPKRGEVVIFRFPNDPTRDFVKRVVGVPGDVVEFSDGRLYLNGEFREEPYVRRPDNANMSPVLVPERSYFVLGDNRRLSNDSRDWGPVPHENLVGKAWFAYWPFDGLSSFTEWSIE